MNNATRCRCEKLQIQVARHDAREPGIFKLEFSGDKIVALNSKTWFGNSDSGARKFSSKGVNKNNANICYQMYKSVLETTVSQSGVNKGFRSLGGRMYSYNMRRDAFTYFYPKRIVASDGIHTSPLNV